VGSPEPKRDSFPGLGAKLLAARKAKGLTQAEVDELAGVDRTNLSQYESDSKTPTLVVLVKLAKAYGVTVDDLLPGDPLPDDPPAPSEPPVEDKPRPRGKYK
jgi:transcriptional regulator with XRE-family HTH domain